METRFTILLWEIGISVVVQVGVLIALLMMVKRTSDKVNALTDDIKTRALPAIDSAQSFFDTTKPRIEQIIDDAASSTATLKQQIERIDATLNDAVDRTRLQVIRADELVTRTMDRVEETSDLVHHSVISPIRQAAGLIQALTAGMGFFFGRSNRGGNGTRERRRSAEAVPQDEMFI